jgi:hypothetical protein
MGDDYYFFAIKPIACVIDVVDGISWIAAIKHMCVLSPMLLNMQVPFGRAKSVVSVLQHAVFCCDSIRSLG